MVKILAFSLLAVSVLSLIWARFFFFKIKESTPLKIGLINDPLVAINISVSLYLIFIAETDAHTSLLAILFYIIALLLFWASINEAGELELAGPTSVQKLLKTGPYSIIRHPLYLSYSLIWMGNFFVTSSLVVLTVTLLLIVLYIELARLEEAAFLASDLSGLYIEYQKETGMFIPTIIRRRIIL